MRWYEIIWINDFFRKNISFTYFMTESKQKVNKSSIFLICISFLLVLGYLLVDWFSLTHSSINVPEDGRCSLMTYVISTLYLPKFVYRLAWPNLPLAALSTSSRRNGERRWSQNCCPENSELWRKNGAARELHRNTEPGQCPVLLLLLGDQSIETFYTCTVGIWIKD